MATMMEHKPEGLEQAEALHTIFESLPLGVIVADQRGRIMFSNPAAVRILGLEFIDAITEMGSAVEGWYLPDQVSLIPTDELPLARAIRGEKVVDELVFVCSPQVHAGVWIRVDGWPLKDADGMVSGGVVMFHDFTQGREERQHFVLLSRVVQQTADSVILTDRQGVIQYVNPAFEVTTGYGKDEALGQTPRILKSGLHDAEFYRQMWAQFARGLPFKGMVINRKKTGELYWAQQTITSMRDEADNVTHFISVSQDITEIRKKQEQENQTSTFAEAQGRFHTDHKWPESILRSLQEMSVNESVDDSKQDSSLAAPFSRRIDLQERPRKKLPDQIRTR